MPKLSPRQTVEYRSLLEPRPPGLIDAVHNELELTNAVRVGVDRDFHSPLRREPGVRRRQVQSVRTGVDLEKGAALPCMLDHALKVQLVPRTPEQLATGGMAED